MCCFTSVFPTFSRPFHLLHFILSNTKAIFLPPWLFLISKLFVIFVLGVVVLVSYKNGTNLTDFMSFCCSKGPPPKQG